MFNKGDLIDGEFVVLDACSDAGGMGTLVFVLRKSDPAGPRVVMKYCKLSGSEMRERFCREVRVMQQFAGSAYVMPVVAANLEHDPPYFVMPFVEQGDLAKHATALRAAPAHLEWCFLRMIDCIEQLHAKNVMHRDIKPQNFLVTHDSLVVSDLGLCTEEDAGAHLTRSSMWWGTPGYIPPEFQLPGGFKNADASADIFMLGKTFYFLVTGRDPMYIMQDGVPPPLFPILERCCAIDKFSRYPSLSSLRQSLTAAFDVLLERATGPAKAHSTLRSIMDRLSSTRQYAPAEIAQFIEELTLLTDQDKIKIALELSSEFFGLLSVAPVQKEVGHLISSYQLMAREATYAWSFAEKIAANMKVLFDAPAFAAKEKAEALRTALIAAQRQNRFAAMGTCVVMISGVVEPELAHRVRDVMMEHPYDFVVDIDESACLAPAVRAAVLTLKQERQKKIDASEGGSSFPF